MKRLLWVVTCLLPCLLSEPATAGDKGLEEWIKEFNAEDRGFGGWIPNEDALDFLGKNAPRFDCPDQELERTYHFRW